MPLKDMLFRQKYLLKPAENVILKAAATMLVPDHVRYAVSVLRTKWFSIDWEIRLKALPFLEHRLAEKATK